MYGQGGSNRMRAIQILGVAVAAVCGLALYWLVSALQEALTPVVGETASSFASLGAVALIGAVSAYLMRSWWAVLIVPASFLVGWYLGGVIDALLPGRLYKPWELSGLGGMLGIFAIYLAPPLLAGATVGVTIYQWLRARRPHGLQSSLPRTAPLRASSQTHDHPPETVS